MAMTTKHKSQSALNLRKDSTTPLGAIWSCFASSEEAHALAEGRIVDAEHMLNVGDIVNVRRRGHQPFSMRVARRKNDLVLLDRVRH